MNEKDFLQYLLKQIPVSHRTDAEANYTYTNLRWIIKNQLEGISPLYDENYPEDYTEEELKEYLKSKGYSYEKFQKWITGQTVGFTEDGTIRYYKHDVERYRE